VRGRARRRRPSRTASYEGRHEETLGLADVVLVGPSGRAWPMACSSLSVCSLLYSSLAAPSCHVASLAQYPVRMCTVPVVVPAPSRVVELKAPSGLSL